MILEVSKLAGYAMGRVSIFGLRTALTLLDLGSRRNMLNPDNRSLFRREPIGFARAKCVGRKPLPIRTCGSRNFIPRMSISDKLPWTFPGFTWFLPYFILFGMFSRGRPRQLETEEELYDVALRALVRRAHSVQEMQKKLSRYTRNELLVRVVMARLKKSGQLNDQRYAQQFARNRTQSRKQGQFRIARELRARGVTDTDINAALEASATETDPAVIVRQRIERKLKSLSGGLDQRRIASIYSSLLRAGFPADLIRRELKRLTREEVPESDPQEG